MQKKLGDILVEEGVISLDQLQAALDRQRETGERLGKVIVDMEMATEDDIQKALAKQLNVEMVDLYEEPIDQEVLELVTPEMIKRHQAIPVRFEDENTLLVAMVDPNNLLAIDDLRLSTGYEIKPAITTEHALEYVFNKYFGITHEAAKSLEEYQQERIRRGLVLDEEEIRDRALLEEVEQAPIVKLVETILNGAVDYRASDIHLEPKPDRMDVRYRIDGMLHKVLTVPKNAVRAVTARLKILAHVDTSERRKPQDGRIRAILRDKEWDIRFSTLPTVHGEKIVMRLLDPESSKVEITDLGFDEEELAVYEEIISHPHGILLITGPTGSGKSTTLIATLRKLAREEVNVTTIEDPVEYLYEGINQVQVNPKVGLTFATGLRSIVRQDPDIIMVGEIRDPETADLAVQAALTGHLVFSTLHTNDAPGAIPRLNNLGVPIYLIDASVLGVMAQRLVRKLCPHCKRGKEPDELEWEIIRKTMPNLDKPPIIYEAVGCKFCNHFGYTGRTGIFEIFRMTPKIRELIKKNTSIHAIKQVARQEGMKTLFESGMKKVLRGITSLEELLRVARPDWEEEMVEGEPVIAKLEEAAPKLAEVEA